MLLRSLILPGCPGSCFSSHFQSHFLLSGLLSVLDLQSFNCRLTVLHPCSLTRTSTHPKRNSSPCNFLLTVFNTVMATPGFRSPGSHLWRASFPSPLHSPTPSPVKALSSTCRQNPPLSHSSAAYCRSLPRNVFPNF